jgi:hypothetical protein
MGMVAAVESTEFARACRRRRTSTRRARRTQAAPSSASIFMVGLLTCGIRGEPAVRLALVHAIRIDLIGRPARRKTHGTIVPSLAARFAIDLAPHKWQGFVRQVESTVIQSDSGRIVFMK